MRGLLRLLGRWRSLPAQLEELERRCVAAEDEVRYWRGKSEVWEAEAKTAHEWASQAYRCFVDWCSMRISGFPVFGGTPPLPRDPLPMDKPTEQPRGKRLARDVVNDISAQYDAELRAYKQQHPEGVAQ